LMHRPEHVFGIERARAFPWPRHAPHDLCLFPHRRPSRRRVDVDTL